MSNDKLKQARLKAELSQSKTADKVGITTMSYQRYEYGERTPNVKIAIKLAKTLHTDVETLFGDDSRTSEN